MNTEMALPSLFDRRQDRASPADQDCDLARCAAQGDREARRALCLRLHGHVRRTLGFVSAVGNDADDLTQVAMVRILRHIGTFQGDSSLERWSERIAIHAAISHMRKNRRREELGGLNQAETVTPPSAEADAELVRVRGRILHHLDALHEKRRLAVLLHHMEGLGVDEIAQRTNASPATVRDRLYKGRKELREAMRKDPVLRAWLEVSR